MNRYSISKLPADQLMHIAENHRALRKQLGYSQQELAKRSDVSLGSLRRFEQSGKISLENLLRLAHVLRRLDDFTPVLAPTPDLKRIERLFDAK